MTNKPIKPKVSKAVKKFVAQQIKASPEIKEASFSIGHTVTKDVPKSWNLMYQSGISHGTSSAKVIGDRIKIRYIKFRGVLSNNVSTNPGATFGVRLGLVKSRHYYTTTSLSSDELFKFGTDDATHNTFDPKRCTLMTESLVTASPQFSAPGATTYTQRPVQLSKKMNYLYTFKDLSSTYEGKLENLYLVATGINTGTTISQNAVGLAGELIFGYTDE
jgi:hypothetical protein